VEETLIRILENQRWTRLLPRNVEQARRQWNVARDLREQYYWDTFLQIRETVGGAPFVSRSNRL
jgi:hypothetical protein